MDKNKKQLKGEVIYIANDEDSRNYRYEKESKSLDPSVQILSIDDIPAIRDTYSDSIYLPSHIRVGDVLIQHPFDKGTYIKADGSAQEIMISKFGLIREIAQKLGAQGCVITVARKESQERKWTAKGEVEYKVVNAETEITSDKELQKELCVKIENRWKGSPITEKSYQRAIEIAQENDLWGDNAVRSLIRMRNPKEENPLLEDSYHFDMSQEANDILDAAFSLSAMAGVFNLKASYKKELQTREVLTIDVNFIFPDNDSIIDV